MNIKDEFLEVGYLVLPKPQDIKAARNYLNWGQKELGEKCDLHAVAITNIEKGKHKAKRENLEKMAGVFAENDIFFLPDGGFRVNKNRIKILRGKTCAYKLQEDIIQDSLTTEKEVIHIGGDERRSDHIVIENERKMYKLGIKMKNLIAYGDTFIMGPLENYRWIDPKYFSDDVIVIYGNKVAFTNANKGVLSQILVINNKNISEALRAVFSVVWNNGTKPTKTTSPIRY